MSKYFLGIDLGGTFTKYCVMDADGMPSATSAVATNLKEGQKGLVGQITAGIRDTLAQNNISSDNCLGIGIGAPGPLSIKEGKIIAAPNMQFMSNCPLRDLISNELGISATLENDANAAAFGEYLCGSGQGVESMVLLTLGTGIGSGIIIDGKILHGSHDMGGEVGHIIVEVDGDECGCGQKGCFERYCSATFIAGRAGQLVKKEGYPGILGKILKEKGQLTSKDVMEAANKGDGLAEEFWNKSLHYLALGCIDICRILDPDKIVLAGGMTKAGEHLIKPLLKHFQQLHWTQTDIKTEIVIGKLGNDAGVIGAAGVARAKFSE